jgi:hypothetical protein
VTFGDQHSEILLLISDVSDAWKGLALARPFPLRARQTAQSLDRSTEALEEAGVVGKVRKKAVGHYSYVKVR